MLKLVEKLKQRLEQQMPDEVDTGPSLTFLQKQFGPSFMRKKRKKDIELPNQSGKTDPRLKSIGSSIMEGFKIFKELGKKK